MSNAIRIGLSIKQVQAIAGHASASTTLDVYTHLFSEDWDDARQRMNRGINGERERSAKTTRAHPRPRHLAAASAETVRN